jgi:hypothetical protein
MLKILDALKKLGALKALGSFPEAVGTFDGLL